MSTIYHESPQKYVVLWGFRRHYTPQNSTNVVNSGICVVHFAVFFLMRLRKKVCKYLTDLHSETAATTLYYRRLAVSIMKYQFCLQDRLVRFL